MPFTFLGVLIAFLIFWVGLILLQIKREIIASKKVEAIAATSLRDFSGKFDDFKRKIEVNSSIDSEGIDRCVASLIKLNNQTEAMANGQRVIRDDTSHMARTLESLNAHTYKMARKRRY